MTPKEQYEARKAERKARRSDETRPEKPVADRALTRSERHEMVQHLTAERDRFQALGHYERALEVIDAASKIAPLNLNVAIRRPVSLFSMGRFNEALAAADRALAAYRLAKLPANVDFLRVTRAEALYALGRFDDAVLETNRAKDQGSVGVLLARARAQAALRHDTEAIGTFEIAMASYQQALDRGEDESGLNNVPFEFAIALLRLGDYERGLQVYEGRISQLSNQTWDVDPTTPLAKRRSVVGRKILIRTEAGLGSFLFFMPYAVALAKAGAKVVLEVPAKLVRLIQSNLDNMGGVEMIQQGDVLPYCDLEWPIGSLPLIFETRLENILPRIPQVTAPADRMEYWKQRLALQPDRKMAVICWTAGDQRIASGQHRTIPLSNIETLLGTQGVTFVSIERFLPAEELERLKARFDIVHVGDEAEKDLADLAAVIALADFIAVPDNTAAHLAAAMGKPVCVMLPLVADWRWHVDREDCPWYPSMCLFRQPVFGDWATVVAHVDAYLKTFLDPNSDHGGCSRTEKRSQGNT